MTEAVAAPPTALATARRSALPGVAAALGAGALVAASLPPWGWWPLAFAGIALLDRLVAGQPTGTRALRAWVFGLGWLAPGMGWMWFLSAPGYLVAVAVYASWYAGAAALAPPGRGRRLALATGLTLAEALRFSFPFGGVPLASLAISQVAGPLAFVARLGGPILLTWVTLLLGVALSALTQRAWRPAVALAAPAVVLALAGTLAPTGHVTGTARVALVQGGGPQGTRAIATDPRVVVERHLAATRTLQGPVDLVVWPENVVDVPSFATSVERTEIAAEAARLNAPIVVGITEDAGTEHFVNAQVVVQPDGSITSRYEKVRRVPFGEYMPFRTLLRTLGAPTDLVPRDAVAGTGPAVLDTPVGRVGVVISWEVFFGGRARDGVVHGGRLLLNPTNGSSYTGTVLQTQQVASSRLRAIENDRWLAQVSPTGFTAFVTPHGNVLDRTGVSEQAVQVRDVQLRTGRTLYSRVGDAPIILAAVAVLTGTLVLSRRRARAATSG